MSAKYSLILILTAATSLAGCAVHHHHYPSEPASESPRQDPPSPTDNPQPTEYDSRETHNTYEPETEPHTPADTRGTTPQPIPTTDGLLANCAIRNYPTGWVEASCGTIELILQTGPAAATSDSLLRSFSAEYITDRPGRYIDRSDAPSWDLIIDGEYFETWDLSMKDMPDTPHPAPDSPGLYSIISTEVGRTGVLCYENHGVDQERCMDYVEALITGSINNIGRTDGPVEIAGVRLPAEGCHFDTPESLLCIAIGYLEWHTGAPRENQTWLDEQFEPWTQDYGIENYHNPHDIYDCRINGWQATCHEISYQGVTSSPLKMYYGATLTDSETSYAFHCGVPIEDELGPCEVIFGDALTGGWHGNGTKTANHSNTSNPSHNPPTISPQRSF